MPNIDPKVTFMVSVIIAVCGVGSNAAMWSGAIPVDIIPILAQWNKILSTVGQVVMPLLVGQGLTTQSRIAAAASLDSVKQVVTTREVAQAAGPDGTGAKVVSKAS
jgi:hypothetical protein